MLKNDKLVIVISTLFGRVLTTAGQQGRELCRMEFDERKRYILQAIVEDYILTALPVGSRSIAKRGDIQLSPATIRNEMSDLEELGFLAQPHTSAGRVPTPKAYRFYVDQLMDETPISPKELKEIREYVMNELSKADDIVSQMARVLAEITKYPSIATMPQWNQQMIRRIQVVSLDVGRVMAIIVTDGGAVYHKVIPVTVILEDEQLEGLSKMMSDLFLNHSLDEALRILSKQEIQNDKQSSFVESILRSMETTGMVYPDIQVSGATNLFHYPEYNDTEKMRTILNLLEEKEWLLDVLRKPMNMNFSILIGPESGEEKMQDTSIVTMSYHVDNISKGVFGIIGPTRMDYRRMTIVLDCIRSCMEELFSTKEDKPSIH